MNKTNNSIKSNKWQAEIKWLADTYEKFCADDLKLICYAREINPPSPAPNIANILRSAAREGLIEAVNEYSKSRWIKSNRVPRQYWRKTRRKKVS